MSRDSRDMLLGNETSEENSIITAWQAYEGSGVERDERDDQIRRAAKSNVKFSWIKKQFSAFCLRINLHSIIILAIAYQPDAVRLLVDDAVRWTHANTNMNLISLFEPISCKMQTINSAPLHKLNTS